MGKSYYYQFYSRLKLEFFHGRMLFTKCYEFKRSCLSQMAKGDESSALLLLHLAAWTIKYAELYPAEIIVLLVITESAHFTRMISRKRCVSL